MEPNSQKELTYRDLSLVDSALSFWSKKGMQGFLGSGLAHDFVEAIRKPDFDMVKATECIRSLEHIGSAYDKDVSLLQALRLTALAPSKNSNEWNNFFYLLIALSANSKYFESRDFSWEDRDELRNKLGLKRINVIITSDDADPVSVVFKRIGNENVWREPLKGYRYATVDDIRRTGFPKGFGRSTLIKTPNGWGLTDGDKYLPLGDVGVERYFHFGISQNDDGDLYVVALVKIN